jgi:subtilisin family serine protease
VGFHSAADLPAVASGFHGGKVLSTRDDLAYALVKVDAPGLARFQAGLAGDDRVKYVERDLPIVQADLGPFVPNDPTFPNQYDLLPLTTNTVSAWQVTLGSTATKVCVTDTGVFRTHPDLAAMPFYYWKDEISFLAAPYDDHGHGTHVTGTIAATSNNGIGIAGMARVSVGHAKVLDSGGSGSFTQVANGIADCQASGAHVISMSLGCAGGIGSSCDSLTMHNAVIAAYNAGILVVAAAGNSGPCTNCIGTPAVYPEAVAITCSDSLNNFCSFSSQGPQAFVMAPGLSTWSTVPTGACALCSPTGYRQLSGTSMSTPHVAGEAALLKSLQPGWNRVQLKTVIGSLTSTKQNPLLTANQQGAGEIEVFLATTKASAGVVA